MKVFIAGARVITSLDKTVETRLSNIISKGFTVLVGDADGVDKLVQAYMHKAHYQNVIVYASNGIARNNVGNWEIQAIPVDPKIKGFDFYAVKDKQMAEDADYGFMVWNGKSKGTKNNIIRLAKADKKALIYLTTQRKFYCIDNIMQANCLFQKTNVNVRSTYSSIHTVTTKGMESIQLKLFDI